MYGGHITDFWDRRTNVSYLQFFFNQKLLESGKHLAPGFPLPNGNLDHQEYATYIEKALPIETPVVFGLHPNAEIGYLTSTGEQILGTVLRLRKGGTSIPDGSIAVGGVREILDSLVKRQPKCFNLILTHEKAKPLLTKSVAPYVVVATQEATRMNLLVEEISRSLGELHKGLNGQLNMSQQMEDLSTALSLNEVPGRNPFHLASWEKFAWPSRKNLQHWFCDLERRIEQLVNWEERLELPRSLWMSLFNPMAFLTAVQQVVARKRSLPLDNMTISTDVTIYRRPEDLNSLINEPSDGAFIHGLFMQGARWMTVEEASAANQTRLTSGVKCAGVIVDSHAKDLLPPMPVLYVKAVSVEAEWEPTSIGYLRPNMYNCPCYYTSFRGPTYVFLATLDTEEPATKWINAGVALLLSSDDHL
jgi:dynein heavy chain